MNYTIISRENFDANDFAMKRLDLAEFLEQSLIELDGENEYGLGIWMVQFYIQVTNQNKEKRHFTIAFQPEERNDRLKAYSGFEMDRASLYGYDTDESCELIEFCNDCDDIILELKSIAENEARMALETYKKMKLTL